MGGEKTTRRRWIDHFHKSPNWHRYDGVAPIQTHYYPVPTCVILLCLCHSNGRCSQEPGKDHKCYIMYDDWLAAARVPVSGEWTRRSIPANIGIWVTASVPMVIHWENQHQLFTTGEIWSCMWVVSSRWEDPRDLDGWHTKTVIYM
jgi:hypothetical protein